jgi:hypothetical protein
VFTVKISAIGSVTLAAGLLFAGCGCATSAKPAADNAPASSGSNSHSASPPTAPNSPSASSANNPVNPPASSPGTTSQPGAPKPCATSSLRVATAQGGGGAAGSFYFDLTFTNTGSSPCTLYGYPGVSFTTAGHSQLGQPAARTPDAARIVTLIPNAEASASVRIPDVTVYSTQDCRPASASLIKVYPPNQFAAAFVPTTAKVCTTSTGRASIGTVVAGDTAGA